MGFFVDDSLFVVTPIVNVFCVSSLFCNIVLSVLSSFLGLTSWLSFVVSSVSLSLSHWYPGSGVVLDCIDS